MAKITVLDKQLAELIAAGEVIERPASVVKELVENSIDAGATSVTVEIQSGGVRLIRITDNGCGIDREDIPTAFLRHATSKVHDRGDLYCISTLGFRGEALASVAAVGRVELLSRTAGEEAGSRYRICGGEEQGLEDAGCPVGTTIVVRDLFYNIPARMKFLKKDRTEGNAVAALMDRLALSHPEISFRLIRDGEIKLQTPGDGNLLSAIYTVCGAPFGAGLIPVEHTQRSMSVSGYISKPECARATRTMQYFFINRRSVKNLTMMAALEEAYKNSIMTGKVPACVLNLTMPWNMVDVNVHPGKLEVKLSEDQSVFDLVYNACRGAILSMGGVTMAHDTAGRGAREKMNLYQATEKPDIGQQQRIVAETYRALHKKTGEGVFSTLSSGKAEPLVSAPRSAHAFSEQATEERGSAVGKRTRDDPAQASLLRDTGATSLYPYSLQTEKRQAETMPAARTQAALYMGICTDYPPNDAAGAEKLSGLLRREREEIGRSQPADAPYPCPEAPAAGTQAQETDISGRPAASQSRFSRPADAILETFLEGETQEEERAGSEPPKLIGELFGTYLLAHTDTELLLIDKHAAHERILFNQLKKNHEQGTVPSQLLLVSRKVTLPKDHYDALLENLDKLQDSGFEIEDFGDGAVLVREIPAVLQADALDTVVQELAESFFRGKTRPALDFFDELYHSIACKAAIKGNTFTDKKEQEKLLQLLAEDPTVRNCPHGRPVMLALTRRELEKMFGRLQ